MTTNNQTTPVNPAEGKKFPSLLVAVIIAAWITLHVMHARSVAAQAQQSGTPVSTVNVSGQIGCDGSQIALPAKGRHYQVRNHDWSLWAPIRGIDVTVYNLRGERVTTGLTFEFQDRNGKRRTSTVGGDTNKGNTDDQTDYVRYRYDGMEDTYFTVEYTYFAVER